MLVVWEPILPSDWARPRKSTLARIADKRARQFWDPQHLVATALNRFAKEKPEQPRPQCCVAKGFNWDEVLLYAPGARWEDAPAAVFWNGPVVRATSGLDAALRAQR